MLSRIHPIQIIQLGHVFQSWVGAIRQGGGCEVWIHITIEKNIVEFYFTNKKEKTNKQIKRKKKSKPSI